MTSHELLLEYLSAFNEHNVNKIIDFLHPDCRVIFNDQVWVQGVEAMRPTYEKDFENPQTSATLIECHEDPSDSNRIRALLKTQDNRLVDVTYVFEGKKMVEHIIHSVKTQ